MFQKENLSAVNTVFYTYIKLIVLPGIALPGMLGHKMIQSLILRKPQSSRPQKQSVEGREGKFGLYVEKTENDGLRCSLSCWTLHEVDFWSPFHPQNQWLRMTNIIWSCQPKVYILKNLNPGEVLLKLFLI